MLVVLSITCGLVLTTVGIHYSALTYLSAFLQRRKVHVRRWVAVAILGMLLAHVIEISLFALGFELFEWLDGYGELVGNMEDTNTAYWYYSFVVYTSLGFGDITPTHELRLMTGLETLTGLILIAWSASFIFMQMHRFWDIGPDDS